MPALQKVKKQAQSVVCKSNLRQWGLIWKLYTEDNNGKFPDVAEANEDLNRLRRGVWGSSKR